MDPFTIALLASAVIGGITAAAKAAPTKAERTNKQKLKGLEKLESAGGLGLTPREQDTAYARQMDPAQRLATQQANQVQAGMYGGQEGMQTADLVNLREAQQRALGQTAQQAGLGVEMQNQKVKELQQQEIEARRAKQEAAALRARQELTGFLSDTASAVPGVMMAQDLGMGGGQRANPNRMSTAPELQNQFTRAGMNPADVQRIMLMQAQNPDGFQSALYDSAYGGPAYSDELAQLLQQYNITSGMNDLGWQFQRR